MSESREVGELALSLIQYITRLKTKRTCKFFKVNNVSTGELSQRQFLVLFTICYYNINTLTEIARLHGQTTGSLSIIISKMVDNGYITKEYPEKDDDGRKVYFIATQKGLDTLKVIAFEMLNLLEEFYNSLTQAQRMELYEGFYLLGQLMEGKDDYEKPIENDSKSFSIFMFKIMINMSNLINKLLISQFNTLDILTFVQFHILTFIVFTDKKTVGDLAIAMGVSQSTISNTIGSLVDDGYLCKKRANKGEDGRKIYFYITEKGSIQMENILNRILAVFDEFYQTLTQSQQCKLYAAVKKLHCLFKSLDDTS